MYVHACQVLWAKQPVRVFSAALFWSKKKLQNAHVPAHSITDIELLGNISTVMGTIINMDIDVGKYRARRRAEGG